MTTEHRGGRWESENAWRSGYGVVPLSDMLAFLGMCVVSAAVYGLACWLGRLL